MHTMGVHSAHDAHAGGAPRSRVSYVWEEGEIGVRGNARASPLHPAAQEQHEQQVPSESGGRRVAAVTAGDGGGGDGLFLPPCRVCGKGEGEEERGDRERCASSLTQAARAAQAAGDHQARRKAAVAAATGAQGGEVGGAGVVNRPWSLGLAPK